MSAVSPKPSEDDLKDYILDTIKRLDRLAERLEVFAEEHGDNPQEATDQ